MLYIFKNDFILLTIIVISCCKYCCILIFKSFLSFSLTDKNHSYPTLATETGFGAQFFPVMGYIYAYNLSLLASR